MHKMCLSDAKDDVEIVFNETDLARLPDRLEQARHAQKHVLVWDQDGMVGLYYDGLYFDFTQSMVEVALSEKLEVSTALDKSLRLLRSNLVSAMCSGTGMILNLGMLAPNFHRVYTSDEQFPASKIFDYSWWRKHPNHRTYLQQAVGEQQQ